MASPKVEPNISTSPVCGNVSRERRHQSFDTESSAFPPSLIQIPVRSPDRSRSIPTSYLLTPTSPGLGKKLDTPRTEFAPSDELTSSDGATYFDTRGTSANLAQNSTITSVDIVSPMSPTSTVPESSQSRLNSTSTVSFEAEAPTKSRTTSSNPPAEKGKCRSWRSKLTSSKKESSRIAPGDASSSSSTTLESPKLEEMCLKNLISSSKISRGKSGKSINVAISQNSSYVLFWTQASINVWDISSSSPLLGRAVLTESNCVLAAVTKFYLAYIIGTRDQKLTASNPMMNNRNLYKKTTS